MYLKLKLHLRGLRLDTAKRKINSELEDMSIETSSPTTPHPHQITEA